MKSSKSKKTRPQAMPSAPAVDDYTVALTTDALKRSFVEKLFYSQGKHPNTATPNDLYTALALAVRERVIHRGLQSLDTYLQKDVKHVCYFSAEFLMGPQLGNMLVNLGIYDRAKEAVESFGLKLEDLLEQEEEPGLGNGGLGRLAACYLDSLATLEVPAIGYGIRYEYGIFDQAIKDGWQVEITDRWLRLGNPWELHRPELHYEVKLGGRTEAYYDEAGRYRVRWVPARVVRGVPYDTPVLGYQVNTCNILRLWRSAAAESFNFAAFNRGDYYGAVEDKIISENISKVLYPNDESPQGKQLRLEQQYFFVSCSLQDMIRIHLEQGRSLENLAANFSAQMNDTHPAIAVAELMRLLVDEHDLGWDTAWEVTRQTLAYTNHTLLPEAMEKWPVGLFAHLLPRHLEIIYELNHRFLEELRLQYPGDDDRLRRMSVIDEGGERYVRMAHLACLGSHKVNGVAALHSDLLRRYTLRDFADYWPGKFGNVTNGVTPRRFLVLSNPGLAALISEKIKGDWPTQLERLRDLENWAEDPEFQARWRQVKLDNKRRLAALLRDRTGVTVDPASIFDIQVKRIHEYKRQHLNALHMISLYFQLKRNPGADLPPRTCLVGGKAAPGYHMAKLLIKLITSIGDVINQDPDVQGRLRVIFFPDFNVKNGHYIYPAADLSEQISTAGMEASGTGNMKFAMNGALTIGTLDGANIEIREEVGADNFFLFGLTAEQVRELKSNGYAPRSIYDSQPALREAVDWLVSGAASKGDTGLFRPLVDGLLHHDPYLLFADYAAYMDCQARVNAVWKQPEEWTRMSILNVARMGKFSSDRSIRDYCREIWEAVPVRVG